MPDKPHPYDLDALLEHCVNNFVTEQLLAPVVADVWRTSFDEQMVEGELTDGFSSPDELSRAGLQAQVYFLAFELGVIDAFGKINEALRARN